jgi:pyruvate dehydrogenase E2 component (dihydrolipoamide acetyltransferase)
VLPVILAGFMATIIEMPKLSDTMTEGTLVKWVKKEGDKISTGDVLAEIETDKATMEMTAFDDGILGKIYVQAGSKAPLGAALGVIVEEGETAPDAPAAGGAPAAAASGGEAKAPAAGGSAGAAKPARASASKSSALTTANGKIKASPLARRIASELGVDLRGVEGTGPGGRIVRADVENAKNNAPAAGGAPAKALQTIRPVAGPDDKRIPLTGMRTIIAERLTISKTQIPHFYLNIEVDAAPILALRAQINAGTEKSGGNKYTVNDFVLKAVVNAAAQVPAVNASFDGDSIVQFAKVNLSVAIAVEDGLVTPVIKDAANKSILELSAAVKDLAGRAKNKKLSPDEFAGGTITVSNLGAYGIDNFDAIINPPQAAILSIGTAKKVPVVNAKGEIVPGDRMWVGLSCDHRVVDGAVGATYLAALKKLLETPALMLI